MSDVGTLQRVEGLPEGLQVTQWFAADSNLDGHRSRVTGGERAAINRRSRVLRLEKARAPVCPTIVLKDRTFPSAIDGLLAEAGMHCRAHPKGELTALA